jgi:tetratricopeptide (TPR) repeat protein
MRFPGCLLAATFFFGCSLPGTSRADISGGLSGTVRGKTPPAPEALDLFRAPPNLTGEPLPAGETTPKSPEQAAWRAILREIAPLFRARRFAEALELLKKAEQIAPNTPEVLNTKASILAEQGNLSEARALYAQVLEHDPKFFLARYNLAELLFMEKKFTEAREEFESLAGDFPRSDIVKLKIFLACVLGGDPEGAARWLGQIDRTGPTACAYYARAATAFNQGDLALGKTWVLNAERDFGRGQHALLYAVLADLSWVYAGDYPPAQP